MAVIDPPAPIVVIGAGPSGIEAALYARFLGYEVTVLEQAEIASQLQSRRDDSLWGPIGENVTPLGCNALAAQQDQFRIPTDSGTTIGKWLDAYVLPLANSDLIGGCFEIGASVRELLRYEDETAEYEEDACHLTVRYEKAGEITTVLASMVIDASGNKNPWLNLKSLGVDTCAKWQSVGGIAGSLAGNGWTTGFPTNLLVTELPYYYCVGARSFGDYEGFRLRHAHFQIRDLFKMVGDRKTLDLYAFSLD